MLKLVEQITYQSGKKTQDWIVMNWTLPDTFGGDYFVQEVLSSTRSVP